MSPRPPPTTSSTLQRSFPAIPIPFLLQRADLLPVRDLPAQRALNWTHPTAADSLFFTRDIDRVLTSVAVQVSGVEAERACRRCREGRGRWTECVVPPVYHGLKTWWACANCNADNLTGCCELYLDTEQLNRLKRGGLATKASHPQTNASAMDQSQYLNGAPAGFPQAPFPGEMPPSQVPSYPPTATPHLPTSMPAHQASMPTAPSPRLHFPAQIPALPVSVPPFPASTPALPSAPPLAYQNTTITPGPKAVRVSPEKLARLYQPVDPSTFFTSQPPSPRKRKRAESLVFNSSSTDGPDMASNYHSIGLSDQYGVSQNPLGLYAPEQHPSDLYHQGQYVPPPPINPVAPESNTAPQNSGLLSSQPRTPPHMENSTHMENPKTPVMLNQPRTPVYESAGLNTARTKDIYIANHHCLEPCLHKDTPSSFNSLCPAAPTTPPPNDTAESSPGKAGDEVRYDAGTEVDSGDELANKAHEIREGLPAAEPHQPQSIDSNNEETAQFRDPDARLPAPPVPPEPSPALGEHDIPRVRISMRPREYRHDVDPANVMKTIDDPTLLPFPIIDHEDLVMARHVAEMMGQPLLTIEGLESELEGWYN